jgi:hypothetical protein
VKEMTETIGGKTCTVWTFSGNPTKTVTYPYVWCKFYPDDETLPLYRQARE